MRGFMLEAPGRVRLCEIPQPQCGPGRVLVRPRAVGICGSDIHAYHGLQPSMVYPSALGHEIAGEVAEIGEGVRKVKVGDHVVLDPAISCGTCRTCLAGKPNVCEHLKVLGVHVNGGFADYVAVNEEQVFVIPDSIPFWIAAFAEPLSIGAQANFRARTCARDFVLILGAGPIGLATLAVAKDRGARVAIVDSVPRRLEVAQQMGADLTLDLMKDDVREAVLGATSGAGADVSIDAVGSQPAIDQAIEAVKIGGRAVVLGLSPADVGARCLPILKKELDVYGSRMSNHQFEYVVDLMAEGRVDPSPAITHRIPFDQVAAAFELAESKNVDAIKIVVTF
ncbi:MAG TPA: zinc-binding alcohol dehydrogenase family protein [Bacillota bacterium]|nr:zinc-binding alcohol dehydrogenase family protein [Bacillota bacterium]HNY68113.1 zinc-binding alcohol dehydrogenase family protein [Bacillota bacterium]HOI36853.1 zinc-binding alcohol dehydrogenase family protein [Bacillota bacterium]HPU74607.1 zinc-binding alcohol dehydrogenase family protein [Bacillota bacterium]